VARDAGSLHDVRHSARRVPHFPDRSIDRTHLLSIHCKLGSSLCHSEQLAVLDRCMEECVPGWRATAKINRTKARLKAGTVAADLTHAATSRGRVYEEMVRKYGRGPNERLVGTVEVRGGKPPVILIVRMDELAFAPSSGCYHWGNSICVQLANRDVDGELCTFARRLSLRLWKELDAWFGHVRVSDEWDAKNMIIDRGTVMAIGQDVSRYLPGLYWLTFFGQPYVDLIGRERLRICPAFACEECGNGIAIQIAESPCDWSEAAYSAAEQRAREHLGPHYFFDRARPDRPTVAPDFGLPPLERHPRFS
jgi:hypothetical protein